MENNKIIKETIKAALKKLDNWSLDNVIAFKNMAIAAKDYEAAAKFRDKEKELVDNTKVDWKSLAASLEGFTIPVWKDTKEYLVIMKTGKKFTISSNAFEGIKRALLKGHKFIVMADRVINIRDISTMDEEVIPPSNKE